MTDNREPPIIIKKYPKKGDGGHGGSWKVAYADFVTALMAFFLLLWLLSMTSQQKKIQLSEYFQNYSVFDKGGGSAISEYQDTPGSGLMNTGKARKTAPRVTVASKLAQDLKKQINEKLKEFKERVLVFDDNGNVRIEIIDTDGSSFFTVGGTELSENGKKIIRGLTPVLKDIDKKLIVEGHTDALGYKGKQFTNWELSTQRASSARIELEKSGVAPGKIAMVVGYADTKPLVKDNLSDPMNRRISIVVDYKGQSTGAPFVPNVLPKPITGLPDP